MEGRERGWRVGSEGGGQEWGGWVVSWEIGGIKTVNGSNEQLLTYYSIGHDVVPVQLAAIVFLLVELLTVWHKILQLEHIRSRDCHVTDL